MTGDLPAELFHRENLAFDIGFYFEFIKLLLGVFPNFTCCPEFCFALLIGSFCGYCPTQKRRHCFGEELLYIAIVEFCTSVMCFALYNSNSIPFPTVYIDIAGRLIELDILSQAALLKPI